ncbi:hypothetical protein HUJ04_004357 [Dendroctonus ponderosae]|nr:hypothetical protein HUJ04_004357 [Dendroctonus ponderosae]KAH1014577.1 hypothetical protein HUJ05_012430 [Dendroctonus ponderosae]
MFLKIALFSFTLYLVNSSVAFANYTEYGLDGKNVYGETEDEIIDPVAEEDDSEDYDSTSEVLSDSASSKATANSRCCAESKTYIIGKQLVKHAAASTLCQRIGMELATVMSPKEERALVKTWKSFGVGRGLAGLLPFYCLMNREQFGWEASDVRNVPANLFGIQLESP